MTYTTTTITTDIEDIEDILIMAGIPAAIGGDTGCGNSDCVHFSFEHGDDTEPVEDYVERVCGEIEGAMAARGILLELCDGLADETSQVACYSIDDDDYWGCEKCLDPEDGYILTRACDC